ncbi:MAG TPA: hypothetical protein VHL54_13330 [Actinomycetota bacterium]|nr:hypothetical protein [Actinomycetota bacterium]
MAHNVHRTNNGKQIHPDLPNSAMLLWMEIDNGNLVLDGNDRAQYLTSVDVRANDGSHSEEVPIVQAGSGRIVGVVHLHWDRMRNLQFMHAKDSMLSPMRYSIPFDEDTWKPLVRHIIQ